MSARAHGNTNPEELGTHFLQAQGPIGFIQAVYDVLMRFHRPYYYGAAVPDWMMAGERGSRPDPLSGDDWKAYYSELHPDVEDDVILREIPHCVIHQYRIYPYKRGTTGADRAGGARRQRTPGDVYYHDRPLPDSPETDDPHHVLEPIILPALKDTNRLAPLWPSLDHVPDLIREHINDDTICYVTKWTYDVFVDFVLTSPNMWMMEQMHRDFMLILRTFFDRSHTGASNLSGWLESSMSGAPREIEQQLDPRIPVRTVTWRLRQEEAYAFPSQVVDSINLELHGEESYT